MANAVRFKVLVSDNADSLTEELNAWAAELPHGIRIRRTQLSAVGVGKGDVLLYALVSYEGSENG
jgi:hypothetical protein